jgi:outer membrane protein
MIPAPRSLAAALLVAIALLGASTDVAATDLLQAWEAARDHDPAFAAARAEWQAGQTRERQARALFMPQVSMTGSAGIAASDHDTTGAQFSAPGFGASNDAAFRTRIEGGPATSLSLLAQQPLYNLEKRASARQLTRQAQVAALKLRSAEQELIVRTAHAYFDVVLAEEALFTLRAQKEAAQRAQVEAQERFEAGASPVTDRNEAQARYDEIRTQEILAENDLEMKRVAFVHLTGRRATGLNRIASGAPLDRFDASPVSDWLERAARDNPLIAMQELGREIAQDEIDKYRAWTSPVVDLYVRVNDERSQGSSGYGGTTHVVSSSGAIGVQLTIPLFTGGMRDAKRDEAAALAQKALSEVQALRQTVLRQTQAAWLAANTGLARVHAHEQALRSARSRLDATETGKEVGARTMLDFMGAQSDFYRAQRNLTATKYQLLLDRLRLAASAGTLSESGLREVNAVLTAGQ